MSEIAKERVEKAIEVLDSCDKRWMARKLRERIIVLVKRVSQRLDEHERLREEQPKESHRIVLELQYAITAMTVFQIAPSIHFRLCRQNSRSGRPYFGVMPRPYQWRPKGPYEPLKALDTHPYTRPLITTDLSKLGKRRLYSRIRAAVWRITEQLDRDEERAWRMLMGPTTPTTNAAPP